MWNIPEAKHIFEKWEVIPKAVKSLSFSHSPPPPSLSAAVFHYQCPNQLVKKSETQTTVFKITEFHHKCPTLPAAVLGSGLRWDQHTTTQTHTHRFMLYASRNTKRSMQQKNCCRARCSTFQTFAHICCKRVTGLHIMRKHANYTHTHTHKGAIIIPWLVRHLLLWEPPCRVSQGCCVATGRTAPSNVNVMCW